MVDPRGEKVTWQLLTKHKKRDGIHEEGFYRAPFWILRDRSVLLLARSTDESVKTAVAKIELSSASFWSSIIGFFWLLTAAALVIGMLTVWPRLRSFTPISAVNPAMVTLQATGAQQFDIAGPGVPGSQPAVTWSINPSVGTVSTGGLYRAPDDVSDQAVTISAAMDGKAMGSATILLRKSRTLTISPSSAFLPPAAEQTFTITLSDPSTTTKTPAAVPKTPAAPTPGAGTPSACDASAGSGYNADPVWSVVPSLGKVDSKGTYKAPPKIGQAQRVSVIVTKQCDSAAASVYIAGNPHDPGNSDPTRLLMAFVMIMGALGSYVHAASSFVSFTGNEQFKSSWKWWYFMRPLIGAALAVIGYFLLGGGYISAIATDTSNLLKIGVMAGLIGLYEEQACVKIGEIFDALFKPSEKSRDPLDTNKTGAPAPAVMDWQQNGRTILVTGTGFQKDCSKVLINGTPAKATEFVSANQLRVTLNDTDHGEISVTVCNHSADGKDSTSAPVKKTLI
jgi:hypothetical protein